MQTARDGVVWHWCILSEIDCSICGSIFSAPQGPGWHCWQGEIVGEKTEEHMGKKMKQLQMEWRQVRRKKRQRRTEWESASEKVWQKVTVPDFTGYFLSDDSFLIGCWEKRVGTVHWAETELSRNRGISTHYTSVDVNSLSLGVLMTHSNLILDFSLSVSTALIFVCTMQPDFTWENFRNTK